MSFRPDVTVAAGMVLDLDRYGEAYLENVTLDGTVRLDHAANLYFDTTQTLGGTGEILRVAQGDEKAELAERGHV